MAPAEGTPVGKGLTLGIRRVAGSRPLGTVLKGSCRDPILSKKLCDVTYVTP